MVEIKVNEDQARIICIALEEYSQELYNSETKQEIKNLIDEIRTKRDESTKQELSKFMNKHKKQYNKFLQQVLS